jgi:hypothetical protein
LEVRAKLPAPERRIDLDGLRAYRLPAALVSSGPALFSVHPTESRAALAMIPDASDVLSILLEGGHSTVAGRIAGGFRNIGRDKDADQILETMRAADYDVREVDPFEGPTPFTIRASEPSPHVTRLRLMWYAMRSDVGTHFPSPPAAVSDVDAYMKRVDEIYSTDAYHSLSIEGYRVTPDLIERVRAGRWNPDAIEEDREQRDALAARGYYDAFQSVKRSIEKVLQKENPGAVVGDDHAGWYSSLFGPSVSAGIVRPSDLAGYRNGPVYIRNSLHVPPSREAVREMMPVLFELLAEEDDPAVRVVLGHFAFVYIHPYPDGNGRMGRFVMNVMLAAGGYPWTVVPVEERTHYMEALESASVGGDIKPFATFLGDLMRRS